MSLKVVVQQAQKEVRKWMVSQRTPEFFALSSKILLFLSYYTTQIKAKQTICHNTRPLLELPNSLYEMVIMSQILLGRTQSILVNLDHLYYSPIKRDDLLILHAPYTTYRYRVL